MIRSRNAFLYTPFQQGDQMSFLKKKIAQKCGPTRFWSKSMHNFYRGKKCLRMWVISTYIFFKKVPNTNNRPKGETSRNLVTLLSSRRMEELVIERHKNGSRQVDR
jgi:hypothetical protein